MRTFVYSALIAAIAAVVSHLAILYSAPGFIMDRAMVMLEEREIEYHAFTLAPRTTPQTQSVVRPSPDLAYSACLFDLDEAPEGLVVRMAATDGYSSLSFFDASTNNFATFRGNGQTIFIELLPPGLEPSSTGQLTSPSSKGIILIRRLAPTVEEYAGVQAVAEGDTCNAISIT